MSILCVWSSRTTCVREIRDPIVTEGGSVCHSIRSAFTSGNESKPHVVSCVGAAALIKERKDNYYDTYLKR